MGLVIAGTGHRLNRLGGYGQEVYDQLFVIAFNMLAELKADTVISGMALGWDQAIADAASIHCMKLIAAVPFEGQEQAWPYTA